MRQQIADVAASALGWAGAGVTGLLYAVLMNKYPKCRCKLPETLIAAGGSLCPGCGTKIWSDMTLPDPRLETVEECERCRAAFPASQLAPAPLVLRIVAFPLILLMLLHRRSNILRHGHELVAKFCPSCRKRQIACYVVVGIWSSALVIGLIYEWVVKNR